MRSPLILAVTLAAGTACSSGSTSVAADPDLARDLQLASMATLALQPSSAANLSPLETTPLAAPAPATKPRAARSGPRRVSARRPTAPSAVTEEVQVEAEADADATVELAGSEAIPAEVAEGGVALPRPVPVSVGLPSGGDVGGDDDYSRGGRGSVIRGGDIDDCRIHDTRRRPVYRPPVRTSGVGGGRWGDVAGRPTTSGEATGGRWGDVARRPETPRTGGTERQRGGSGGTTRGGVWGAAARGRQ